LTKLISRKAFAEKAGVSGAAITKACSTTLKGAVCKNRINIDHADAKAYLNKHNTAKTSKKKPVKKSASKKTGAKKAPIKKKTAVKKSGSKKAHTRGHVAKNKKTKDSALKKLAEQESAKEDESDLLDAPENIEKFLDMTLGDIIDRFGTDIAFKDYLDAVNKIEQINEKRLKNAVRMGILCALNIKKNTVPSPGVQGSNAIKIFDYNMASTGLSETSAIAMGFKVSTNLVEDASRAEFMPTYDQVKIKIVYETDSRRLIGAQLISKGDYTLAIHTFSLAIQKQMTVDETVRKTVTRITRKYDADFSNATSPTFTGLIL
jgi:hypothetical protein